MKIRKNLFEEDTLGEVMARIGRLQPDSVRQWGETEPAQMLAHCSLTMSQALGELNMPRAFIGCVLGPFLKPLITNDTIPPKNGPSAPELVVCEARDFQQEQDILKGKLHRVSPRRPGRVHAPPHPLVGRLSPYAWSRGVYKHLDHHLRQFRRVRLQPRSLQQVQACAVGFASLSLGRSGVSPD